MVNEKYFPISDFSLPISVRDMINLPLDEFNDLLAKHWNLTEDQLNLSRDIWHRTSKFGHIFRK